MKNLDEIVIVGGGSAAWLAAALLAHNTPELKLTVIDKEVGTPVGVGEGTLLNFEIYLKRCGFSVDEWFTAVDATYKTAILFPNWDREGNDICHPFFEPRSVAEGMPQVDAWTNCQQHDFREYGSQFYDCNVNQDRVDLKQPLGYHVDASKLVVFIKEKLKGKVTFIQSEMVTINRDSNEYVKSLVLKNGQTITGDLFIDCTGFKSLLNQAPKRVNLDSRLFCDTAIAGHVPYLDREKEMHPYVRSEAVDHGWVWNIPVRTRIGSGLVFKRSITDVEDAKDYFVKYWDNRIQKENLKVIDWTPFYNENFWHENVVSIGLAAGFIEPLESTGLVLIMEGMVCLLGRIRDHRYNDGDIELYNNVMKYYFEETIDFVSMHYAKSTRTTPFWNYVKEHRVPSERELYYADLLKNPNKLIPNGCKDVGSYFSGESWGHWLIQLGYEVAPKKLPADAKTIEKLVMDTHTRNEKYRGTMSPMHHEAIERLEALYNLPKPKAPMAS